jgi:general secretion pathway protein B
MSILLEALRKSEKSQRAHEVPTIHADDEVATVPESLATGPLAMLLVSALFMSGWFVWHQYQVPASAAQPTVAGIQEPAPDSSKPAVGSQPPVADTPTPTPVDASQAKSSKAVDDKPAGKQRTPMESYKAPARSAPKIEPADTERVAVTPPPTKTTATPPSAKTADTGNNQSISADASVKKPVAVTRPKPQHEVPRPIGYWELPDSVRANVPEIKFSVLVYATNPSDRFVLINGERLVEGDNAGPELVVKEIRRDGVIFSYRLYQFLVEK